MPEPYVSPNSITEAMKRRADLVAEIISIQTQLSERKKLHEGCPTDPDYQDWRGRAVFVLNSKQVELVRIKAYLTAEAERRYPDEPSKDPATRSRPDPFFESIHLACDSHKSLQREVARLRAEVERLEAMASETATHL